MYVNNIKLKRKLQKYENILFNDTGIKVTTISRIIMVCNAGLSSGYSEEKIVEIFSPYGTLEKVFMVPMKSYCFLEFKNDLDAKNVVSLLNGKLMENTKTVFYLLLTEDVPDFYNPFDTNFKPAGLYIYDDFLTEEEESELINFANSSEAILQLENVLKHRQVEHFGYKFCYDSSNVCKKSPLLKKIPENTNFIINRFRALRNDVDWSPNQLTINHYEPGQGIPPHIDSHDSFDDTILSLSLGSDIIMDFRNGDGNYLPILLRRRSLLVMSAESRLIWDHGIASRKYDVIPSNVGLTLNKRNKRISYTFRRIRNGPCACPYINCCDSRLNGNNGVQLDELSASELEQMHVHTVYEKIAEHFSETRQKPWPNVVSFINALEPGSILADIGCANGRFFGINTSVFQIGCDMSIGLCSICASKGHQVVVCDCLRLPFRSNCVDACISIAVIHHLSTIERRRNAIREMIRILRPGGKALVYVWAKEQRRKNDNSPSTYLKQNFRNKPNRIESQTGTVTKTTTNVDTRDTDDLIIDETKSVTTGRYKIGSTEETDDKVAMNCSLFKLEEATIGNNLQQTDNDRKSKFVFPIHENRTEFNHSDVFVEWKIKSIGGRHKNQTSTVTTKSTPTYLRFYHMFRENELEELCRSVSSNNDMISIIKSYYDEGNWCIVFQKRS